MATLPFLTVLLDNNVALPSTIEIRALLDGQLKIVVANRAMNQRTINFPKTSSNSWIISFSYVQPLRISELKLNQDNADKTNSRSIRFLSQPNHSYRIYFDPDRRVTAPVGEAGNLYSFDDVLILPAGEAGRNPEYVISDVDLDGRPDINDNCVTIDNPDQTDINDNGRGDACDDFDKDGLINSKDNCPANPNKFQTDTDSDGRGDACDNIESRITERQAWIPWAGIGFAAAVLVSLLILTARSIKPTDGDKS